MKSNELCIETIPNLSNEQIPTPKKNVYAVFFIKSNEARKYLSGAEKTASSISYIQQGCFLHNENPTEPNDQY